MLVWLARLGWISYFLLQHSIYTVLTILCRPLNGSENCFRDLIRYDITVRYKNSTKPPEWVKVRKKNLSDYERLIKEVRGYRPKPQQQIYTDSLMKDPGGRYAPPMA